MGFRCNNSCRFPRTLVVTWALPALLGEVLVFRRSWRSVEREAAGREEKVTAQVSEALGNCQGGAG